MKISIITVAFNSASTIRETLESVKQQTHPDIEHIVVDGASSDDTVAIVRGYPHVATCVSEPDSGLYDAINKGIRLASGDFVGILNSDDFLTSNDSISDIVSALNRSGAQAVYGDVAFVDPHDLQRVVRSYSSKKFRPRRFRFGYMPAHPTFYAKRELFEQYGHYKLGYKISADFELLLRFLLVNSVSTVYLAEDLVYMRTGGLSNASLRSRYVLNKEIVKACKENGVSTNMLLLSAKYLFKPLEYLKPKLGRIGKGSEHTS